LKFYDEFAKMQSFEKKGKKRSRKAGCAVKIKNGLGKMEFVY
jgi:hypothetical protein